MGSDFYQTSRVDSLMVEIKRLRAENQRLLDLLTEPARLAKPPPIMLCADCPNKLIAAEEDKRSLEFCGGEQWSAEQQANMLNKRK